MLEDLPTILEQPKDWKSSAKLSRLDKWVRASLAVLIGLGAAFFPAVALLPTALLLLGYVVAVISVTIYGVGGTLAIAPAVLAIVQIKRFDEQLGIPVGRFTLIPTYWFGLFCLVGLLLTVPLSRSRDAETLSPPKKTFLRWFWILWTLIVVTGLISSIYNMAYDRYVLDRSVLGEYLALGMIVFPMAFAGALPIANLTERQTLRAIRTIVAFLSATAFLMAFFAMAPERIVGALGITQRLDVGSGFVRGWTPFGAANSVAAFLILIMPLTVVMGFRERSLLWRLFYLGCSFVLLVGLLFCRSRSGLAVAVPILFLSCLYVVFARGPYRVRNLLLLILFAIGAGIVVVVLFLTFDFSRFWSRDYYGDASIERRWESLITAMEVFADHPVFGVSPNAVYTREDLEPDFVSEGIDEQGKVLYYRGRASAYHPHNLILTVLAEFGLVGGTVMFIFFAFLWLTLYRSFRKLRHTSDFLGKDHLFAFCAGLVGFAGTALGGALFFYSIRMGLVLWILVGLMFRYAFLHQPSETVAPSNE
ncbi:MAG TPA: O-antigen ligase family protein [Candidatus Hydrogenedentes bacterium]|nr:O-antigen ligase family protein [Candidatus Hydrogenedentota bacterium]HOL76771.1 O-antigen ligase family protein [Candidatus Hydrogenedentota bacterium]HPO85268.1 O-antigen ligase family protein [Candidatus Hydrogenedentota bacterium]